MSKNDGTREPPGPPEQSAPFGADEIAVAEAEALSIEDADDREWALYMLAKRLAQARQWDRAEAVARTIETAYERAAALQEIAARLAEAGDKRRARENLSAAREVVSVGATLWVWHKAEALAKIAQTFWTADERDSAREVWGAAVEVARAGERGDDPQDSVDCSSVLWEVSEYLALAGEFDEARSVAEAITHTWKRRRAVETVMRIADGDRQAAHQWE